jgi:Phage XkdN-like tail assembly chaperone protein, TAC
MSLLDAFLKADTNVEQDVYIKRFDDHIRVKALLEDSINKLKEQATHTVGKGKNRKEQFNAEEFNGLLIAEACVNIDFGDPKMLQKYGARDAGDCVRKALFAGEVMKLQEAILRLSGFDDGEDAIDEAKN